MDLVLDVIDTVVSFDLQCDGLGSESLDKDVHFVVVLVFFSCCGWNGVVNWVFLWERDSGECWNFFHFLEL